MALEIKITLSADNEELSSFRLQDGETTTIYHRKQDKTTVPAFSLQGKAVGGDIIGDKTTHLPCFQLNSERMLQKARIKLSDKIVEISVV